MAEELAGIEGVVAAIAAANKLAIAFWSAGDILQAVVLLDQALEGMVSELAPEHPARLDVLSTLAEIMLEQSHWAQARDIYREVLECCIRRSGENHPSSLAARGDLAIVLFELGEHDDAAEMEEQALAGARLHLGKRHSVTSVLAWNRALRWERVGHADFAKRILADDLTWLLTKDEASLDDDQKTIRGMLAKRLNWDAASLC
jgi:tetratricopeptide (TPR) repeat protein